MTLAGTKTERLADNRRRAAIANKEYERQKNILDSYLNSAKLKQLRKNVDTALDAVNAFVEEWNDIILEESVKRNSNLRCEESGNPVSVNGQLVYGYKDDPKSW